MSGKLTFGYLYDFRNPPQFRLHWEDLYAEILDVVAWTEQAGFTEAWVPEYHLAEDGYMPSPLVTLTAMAARTSTIRLSFRSPSSGLRPPMQHYSRLGSPSGSTIWPD